LEETLFGVSGGEARRGKCPGALPTAIVHAGCTRRHHSGPRAGGVASRRRPMFRRLGRHGTTGARALLSSLLRARARGARAAGAPATARHRVRGALSHGSRLTCRGHCRCLARAPVAGLGLRRRPGIVLRRRAVFWRALDRERHSHPSLPASRMHTRGVAEWFRLHRRAGGRPAVAPQGLRLVAAAGPRCPHHATRRRPLYTCLPSGLLRVATATTPCSPRMRSCVTHWTLCVVRISPCRFWTTRMICMAAVSTSNLLCCAGHHGGWTPGPRWL